MSDQGFSLLFRFRYFLGSLLIVACLPLFSIFISLIGPNQAQAQVDNNSSPQLESGYNDNPNLVADGFSAVWSGVSEASVSVTNVLSNVNDSLKTTTISAAKTASDGAIAAAHGVGQGVSFATHAPVLAWHGVASVTHIDTLISPAAASKNQAPQIDPTIAAEIANSQPLLSATPATQAADATPQWPIRGMITEEFGVPHWPYQPIHTGIDISDGTRAGITPIRPFESGRIVAVVHSAYGFGNHVIVDHGGGLLSLYGHMDSTAVQVGQTVNENTVLGYEGTTGLSTGVHVHFEIDLNGQPVNPHLYVAGQP